jgi:hypothetical protein
MGIIAAVAAPVYQQLKAADLTRARNYVKDFTKHNDKLGFDYNLPLRSYV